MATTYSRQHRRREAAIDEALAHAVDIMTVEGVGALSISEMARRMGIRPPSLYKYFPSLHAVYDELFARGVRAQSAAVLPVLAGTGPGPQRLAAAAVAIVRWSVEHPALAQLLFARPVPGFEPSPESYAPSVEAMAITRDEFAAAIEQGYLRSDTDLDEIVELYTVVISGVVSQQLANEPGVSYELGRFSARTERVVEIFFAAYESRRSS